RYAFAVAPAKLQRWAAALGETAEVIAAAPESRGCQAPATPDDVVELCRRHPSTAHDIAIAFGWTPQQADQKLARLVRSGTLRAEERDQRVYYCAAAAAEEASP
ncbi:MAG: hypothetical protein D6744_17570, partial [Planctomycetota bacterium]